MTSRNSKISVKISSDIDKPYINKTYILTPSPPDSPDLSPMQISAKTARKIAQNDEQFDLYYYYSSSIKVYLALGYDTYLTKLGFKYIHIFAALKQQDLMFCTTSFMQY